MNSAIIERLILPLSSTAAFWHQYHSSLEKFGLRKFKQATATPLRNTPRGGLRPSPRYSFYDTLDTTPSVATRVHRLTSAIHGFTTPRRLPKDPLVLDGKAYYSSMEINQKKPKLELLAATAFPLPLTPSKERVGGRERR